MPSPVASPRASALTTPSRGGSVNSGDVIRRMASVMPTPSRTDHVTTGDAIRRIASETATQPPKISSGIARIALWGRERESLSVTPFRHLPTFPPSQWRPKLHLEAKWKPSGRQNGSQKPSFSLPLEVTEGFLIYLPCMRARMRAREENISFSLPSLPINRKTNKKHFHLPSISLPSPFQSINRWSLRCPSHG